MSTIDIGITELPTCNPVRVDPLGGSTLPQARTRMLPATDMATASVDFYVGSVKIELLPTNEQTEPVLRQSPVC